MWLGLVHPRETALLPRLFEKVHRMLCKKSVFNHLASLMSAGCTVRVRSGGACIASSPSAAHPRSQQMPLPTSETDEADSDALPRIASVV